MERFYALHTTQFASNLEIHLIHKTLVTHLSDFYLQEMETVPGITEFHVTFLMSINTLRDY